MKWYSSYKFRPKHGTQIFIWDLDLQKEIMINSYWNDEDWTPNASWPFWAYVLDEFEPISWELLEPKDSKKEDSHRCRCYVCKFDLKHADLCPLVNKTMEESCEIHRNTGV